VEYAAGRDPVKPSISTRRDSLRTCDRPVVGRAIARLLAAILLVAACDAHRSQPRPSVLLITVDTLRPDALGWVAGLNATPAIDALAREGFAFFAAVTPTPLTLPAHASLMTSLLPRRHAARENGQLLLPDATTLAERLALEGYDTAAFVSGFPLRATFGLDRGFTHYDDALPRGPRGALERRADATTERALSWLRHARPPWFLWVHYFDPHDPYEPHADFPRSGPRSAYWSEVAYVDHWIGRLRRGVEEVEAKPVLTVLAADHGESFGEHGETTHGFFLYDTTVLVPLIFHWPGRIAPGTSALPARLIDVAPTVLALLGSPPLPGGEGTSLLPTLAGEPQELAPALLETLHPWLTYGWAPLVALRTARWKLIDAPRVELYDLVRDPGENHDASDAEATMRADLRTKLAGAVSEPAAATRRPEEEGVRAALAALGYLAPAGDRDPPPGLADPKDRVAERRDALAAEALARAGRYREAVAAFDALLANDPNNRFALLRSGLALQSAGDPAGAAMRLERAVAVDPEDADARDAFADALMRSEHPGRAAEEWREVVRLQPRRARAWANLGTALAAVGRAADALPALARAAALAPADPEILASVALTERALGENRAALEHLQAAAALGPPDRFRLAATLGLLLRGIGRDAEARPWLERARPGDLDFEAAQDALAKFSLEPAWRDGS